MRDTDTNCYPDRNRYTDCYFYRYTECHAHSYCDCHGYRYSHSYGHINGNSYRYSPTHADTAICANAQAAAHANPETLIASDGREVITNRVL